MTDLEKLNRPISYQPVLGYSTIIYEGTVVVPFGKSSKYYFCVEYGTKKLTHIRCYSLLDNHTKPIADNRVKKTT